MKKIRAGIIGGAGYTGGELLRVLIRHPEVEIVFVHSKSNNARYLYQVHTDLLGESMLKFTNKVSEDIDVLFLCVAHGDAIGFIRENHLPETIKIIDLSQDFRMKANATYGKKTFVYGLPEINREEIQDAKQVANPGCFATCLQLALVPLAANQLLNGEVHISGTTGSTGAGHALNPTSHFSWRNNNMSCYKPFDHQHLNEVEQSIKQLQPGFKQVINFLPNRGSFTRGIFSTIYLDCELSLTVVKTMYQDYYSSHPFVFVSETNIDLKQVVNTNKCLLYLEKNNGKILIASVIDNLLKGASGQAVQNMNLMFGLQETTGLKLKASAF